MEMSAMTIYEITNPSDPYTLAAPDFRSACVAVVVLGEGNYGLREVNGERTMPLFLFGGHDEWFQKQFGMNVADALQATPRETIVDVLQSVIIGNKDDRIRYEAVMQSLTEPARQEEWRKQWYGAKKTSMNDIGAQAEAMLHLFRQAN
jgi:hypothetical protein